jgi:hypothetical protein
MAFDWEASVEDVAALLPQRTKGEYGTDGEFKDDGTTTPSKKQVENLLKKAASRIAGKLNVTEAKDICPNGPLELAREVHALRAAMMVELTFFANQLRTDQSPYEKLKEQYDEGLEDLLVDYENQCGDNEGEGLGGEKMPSGNFPRARPWGRMRF